MPHAPTTKPAGLELYFDDPRLHLPVFGRFLVRGIATVAYLVLTTAAFVLIFFPELRPALWFGIFLLLFLIDRALHLKKSDRILTELPETGRANLARFLSPQAEEVLENALDHSSFLRTDLELELCRTLSKHRVVREAIRRLDIKLDEFQQKLDELAKESIVPGQIVLPEARLVTLSAVVLAAHAEAEAAGHECLELTDLVSVLPLLENNYLKRLFGVFSVSHDDLAQALIFGVGARGMRGEASSIGSVVLDTHRRLPHRIVNRAWTSRPTPNLDQVSTDLTDLARVGAIGFLIGHEAEYDRLLGALSRPINCNVLLVGDVGIGKETIIEHLAFRLIQDDVPKALFDRRLVSLDLPALVSGADPSEIQKRVQNVVLEITRAGNIILVIPEIHNLVRTSGTAYLSAADALLPILRSDTFPVIGTSYPREFREMIEPRSDFMGEFEIVNVAEITPGEAERILTFETVLLERRGHTTVSFGAIKTAVQLAVKYPRGKFLPSSAEELLRDAIVRAERTKSDFVGPEDVVSVTEEKVNVPIHEATASESERLLHLEDTIHERLIDQTEAVHAVSEALREYRSGITRKGGPIASFLFVGPTGVGKTELAKILAKVQFGSEKAMVRFDMTEYQDKASYYRLVGSPDGKTTGALTDAVREAPYRLVLLDEFEKAYADVLNLFLQVLDDGRLTDSLGRTVNFQNTIIIATSNAHSDIINTALAEGKSMNDIETELKRRLTDVFKPELINRFSKTIIFKNLSPADTEQVAKLNLKDLISLVGEQGIQLEFDPELVVEVAKRGFDPSFGARPLRRTIDDMIRAPLADKILRRELVRGMRVQGVLKDGKVDFVPITAAPAEVPSAGAPATHDP